MPYAACWNIGFAKGGFAFIRMTVAREVVVAGVLRTEIRTSMSGCSSTHDIRQC